MRRMIFQDWIVELGRDPALLWEGPDPVETAAEPRVAQIATVVRAALGRLPEADREFLERYYFMGQGYPELERRTGRPRHRFESLHRRAIRRLRRELARFAQKEFGIEYRPGANCPLCRSKNRPEIDRLIAAKQPDGTWRPIIRTLRDQYHITVTTPQIVLGHAKYH